MKLASNGLLNSVDNTILVNTSGNAATATTASSCSGNAATATTATNATNATYAFALKNGTGVYSLLKFDQFTNAYLNNNVPKAINYSWLSNNGLNLTTNFKCIYTVTMRNQFYFKAEFIFSCSNGAEDHSYILISRESNMLNNMTVNPYTPEPGKFNAHILFGNGAGYLVVDFSTLNVNQMYSLDKGYNSYALGGSQNIANLESTQIVETVTWPRL